MCGIAGYVNFSGSPQMAILEAMAGSIAHRGPDDQNCAVIGPCGLAHRRLSIIDIAGSPQPMHAAGTFTTLAYNGELYDYKQLRTAMQQQGVTFQTAGDTEVILRYVDRDWDAALNQFDGMFAFAAWHSGRQSLMLARDPFGKKPLFYASPHPGLLIFGSEIKALLQHPALQAQLDEDSLRQALRFRAVYGDRSLYAGIRQVEPGCWIEFSRGGLRRGRYYDLVDRVGKSRSDVAVRGHSSLVEDGERLLVEAVRKRLIADVPVGAFLSGGLDSSLIAAVMRECRAPDAQTRTFSVGFRGDADSELPFAKQVADHLGTHHTQVHVDESQYAAHFAEMTEFRDSPISEPADIAIGLMSRVAARSVKVVLSGEGADEVFCGYPKYSLAAASGALRWLTRVAGADRLAHLASLFGVDHRRALVAARSMGHVNELDRLTQWFSYVGAPLLGELLPGLDWSAAAWAQTMAPQAHALQTASGFDPMIRMQLVDFLTWLPGNLLERGDRMTMQAGLEARVPFLDKALVSWGIALPNALKMRRGTGKRIVRQWAAKRLPSEIVNRRKWGFRVPLADWFRGSLRPMLFDYLQRSDGLCGKFGHRASIAKLLESHDQHRVDANLTLWTLLSAEVWYQDVFCSRDCAERSYSQSSELIPQAAL